MLKKLLNRKRKERKAFLRTLDKEAEEYHSEQERINETKRDKIEIGKGISQFFCPCGCGLFREANRLGKISGIVTGNGQPALAIIKVYVCELCERETNMEEILKTESTETHTIIK